jgi:hypothetical protein
LFFVAEIGRKSSVSGKRSTETKSASELSLPFFATVRMVARHARLCNEINVSRPLQKSERRPPARLEPANSQRAVPEAGAPIVNGAGFAEVSFRDPAWKLILSHGAFCLVLFVTILFESVYLFQAMRSTNTTGGQHGQFAG